MITAYIFNCRKIFNKIKFAFEMKLPADKQLFESELSTYWFDDEGILMSLSKSPKRTLENTRESFELVKRITNNKKACLLVYLANSKKPDKQTLEYVRNELPNVYKAMAMVSKSGLGEIIMNIIFKLKPPAIPMKTFSNEAEAKKWLKQYL